MFFVLGLVVASTLFLAARSTDIHRRTTALTESTTTTIAPALRNTQELIVALAQERSALLRHTLAVDPTARGEYERFAALRAQALSEIVPLATRVGGAPLRHARRLQHIEEQWIEINNRLEEANSEAAAVIFVGESSDLFRAMLTEATSLEESLRVTLEDAWEEVSAAERVDWYYTLGQVVVALAAAIFIVRLVYGVRLLADISERRRREAEAANEDRARLIRGITHDVKNPLGVADMSAQLLEMDVPDRLSADQRVAIERIRRGIGSALEIITHLLELSRAEAGQLTTTNAPTDVGAIVRQMIDDYRSEAGARSIELSLEIDEDLPPTATDPNRVRQILGNLMSNAFKFTPDGRRITVSATMQRADGKDLRDRLVVSVANEGPGIRPEERGRIFSEFYRSDEAIARTPGLGLGLAISRRIARLLDGDLDFTSEPGRLTVFSLVLPIRDGA